ncbi:MAG: MEDS domain-containing protein [Desulforhopalus sp.]|nr:MEDS domain-containing protein [Desulforhopalus sp.]
MNTLPDTLMTELPMDTMIKQKHVMLLYDSLEYYRYTACRYIRDGLEHNERCVMATDEYPHDMIKKDFADMGFESAPYIEKGQLIFVSVKEAYSGNRAFDPNETMKDWQVMTDQACADGYNRLRIVGEATFGGSRDTPESYRDLIYYENIINKDLFPFYPFLSLCVYAKELYPPEVIKAAIQAHPMLIYNDALFTTNIYYVPPEIYFQERAQEEEIDRWLANVAANNATAQELVESEKKFRTIFNNANDRFFIHALTEDNLPGPFLEVNDEAVRALGYSRDELLHLSPQDQELMANEPGHISRVMNELLTKGHATFESRHCTKDGTIHPVEVSSHLFSLKKTPVVFSVARDISSRKQAEKREKNLLEQLRQLQKTEAMGTLAGGIAHDFNNILTIIMGYTELAMGQLSLESPAQKSLQRAHSGCVQAKEVVGQLLTFARKEKQQKEDLDIRPVIKESLEMLRSTIPDSIGFTLDLPPNGFPLIKANPTQIQQILLNLCTNASHAMQHTSGVLTVRVQEVSLPPPEAFDLHLMPGLHVLLSVQDTGKGISPADREHIFEPYFTTKNAQEGTGLGLSVVQGIVKSHAGEIRCSSKLGQGTTFDVFFPGHVNGKAAAPHEEIPQSLPRGTETVLFVDDEKEIALLGERHLTLLGYTVCSATEPLQALALFRSDPKKFNLVITDKCMPGMDGFSLAREIHAIDKDIPIIMCSGFNNAIADKSNPACEIVRYLDKPVDKSVFAHAIREVLDTSRKT